MSQKQPRRPEVIDRAYIRNQRWFQNKGEAITGVEPVDRLEIGGGYHVGIFEISFRDVSSEPYLIPVKIVDDVAEAVGDGAFFGAFFERLWRGEVIEGANGRLVFRKVGDWHLDFSSASFELADVGSSNSLITVKQCGRPAYILKLLRRLRPGRNVEADIGRFLCQKTSFRDFPAVMAEATYDTDDGCSYHVATLFDYVENRGSGWDWTIKWLKRVIKDGDERGLLADEGYISPSIGEYGRAISDLGRILASLHSALATDGVSGFGMLPVEEMDVRLWSFALESQLERTAALIEKISVESEALNDVRSRWGEIRGLVKDSSRIFRSLKWKIRQHADFHLGQVLVTDASFCIIDFEGEPLKPYSERAIHYPALKDVAGMLRSFNYAAFSVFFDVRDRYEPGMRRLVEGLLRRWENEACRAFLGGYYSGLEKACARFLPLDDRGSMERVLALLMLEKALYEVEYEANNRPGWLSIPLGGILEVL